MAAELLNHARGATVSAAAAAGHLEQRLDALIQGYYDGRRNVLDYSAAAVSDEYRALREAANALAGVEPASIGPASHQMAFWLNVYNTLTLHIVLARGIEGSIRDAEDFFMGPHYCINGHECPLDVIEHGILRCNGRKYLGLVPALGRGDPRLAWSLPRLQPAGHFGLYTACRSSPRLRVFHGDRVDDELAAATRDYLAATVTTDDRLGVVWLPAAFKWYASDFGRHIGDILAFVAHHLPREDPRAMEIREQGEALEIQYLDYDWTLNGRYADVKAV